MRLLVAESDPALCTFLQHGLDAEHYAVEVAGDEKTAEQLAGQSDFDLLILDLNTPSPGAFQLLRQIRERKGQVPILALTAHSRPEDRVLLLDQGADDCMLKPFAFRELSARVRALLRRGRAAQDAVLRLEDLELDRIAHTVRRAQKPIELTPKEFQLLEFLLRNRGKNVTRSMIIQQVWNLSFDTRTNVVDVYINYLRGGFDASLVSVEQLAYSEFLSRLAELNFMSTILVHPTDARAALQIDMPLVFPIVDLLLGGPGHAMADLRDLTEIEEQIMESVVVIILRELHSTWRNVLEVEFVHEQRLKQAQVQTFLAPAEKLLALSFEIRLTAARGMLNLIFPGLVSALLLRKLASQGRLQRHHSSAETAARLRSLLLECPFDVELLLPRIPARIGDVLELEPGQILPLRRSIHEPMHFSVGGCPLFTGVPVSCAEIRGGLVQDFAKQPRVAQEEPS